MQFTEEMFARHMRPINGSAIREIFKLLAKPGMISFAGGNPSNTALEPEVISELAREALAKYGTTLLQYGATDGFGPFRESAAEFLRGDGVKCEAAHILPVQGGSQAFDLLLKALIDPGDVVLCESPTFLGAIQAMREYNAKLVPMPTDDQGVIVEAAEELIKAHHPKLMYVIPTFQNPTGITLSLERARRWRRWRRSTAWSSPRTTPTATCAIPARRCPRYSPSTRRAGWCTCPASPSTSPPACAWARRRCATRCCFGRWSSASSPPTPTARC